MRKKMSTLLFVLVCVICALGFVACDNQTETSSEEKYYTIAWTDGINNNLINVKSGELYSITDLPSKEGYKFLGLFDAQVGGRQYVGETGMCTAAFVEDRNMVLFAQYAPKEYTIIFDYQGAEITDMTTITEEYNSTLARVPLNLYKEHQVFVGWYTENNGGGVCI
ncbi:MAG: InlB B-repeat-containing protein, partial [Clostridia bacterium]|nr:InlB B-repeat-containing protein [Clostridia bacterium]